jgi:chemotaxis protein MotB
VADAPQEKKKKQKKLRPERITQFKISGFDVMFTSLGMIMLAFFILLNTFAVIDAARERAVIGSLMGSFGVLPSGVGPSDKGTVSPEVEEVSLHEEVILFAAFEAFLKEQEIPPELVEVFVDEEGRRRIRFNDQFLFGSGSIRFHPRVMPVLDRLAAVFRKLNRSIEVEGHTDSRGTRSQNRLLSAQRAAMVLRYFEEAGGLSAHKLTAVGKGATNLRFGQGLNAGNRRVEIVVQ